MNASEFRAALSNLVAMNHKPADLTDTEWKWERRMGKWLLIAGAALFVVIVLLIA